MNDQGSETVYLKVRNFDVQEDRLTITDSLLFEVIHVEYPWIPLHRLSRILVSYLGGRDEHIIWSCGDSTPLTQELLNSKKRWYLDVDPNAEDV